MIPKFKARKVAIGSSMGVIIPKALAELLDNNTVYEFTIKEVDKNGDEDSAPDNS